MSTQVRVGLIAVALVALRMTDARHASNGMANRNDPGAPYAKPKGKTLYVKELVRVHHVTNCLLCHPPSTDIKDPVRGLIPETNEPIVTGPAYYRPPPGTEGIFVRADTTYLEQDFSAMLRVERPGLGASEQRFDFFVRERAATPREIEEDRAGTNDGPTDHRRAIRFALAEPPAATPIARR